MTQLMPVHDPLLSLWQSSVLEQREERNVQSRFTLASNEIDDPMLVGLIGHTYAFQHNEPLPQDAPVMRSLGFGGIPSDPSPAEVQTRFSELSFGLARARAFGRESEAHDLGMLWDSWVTKYGTQDLGWRECWRAWDEYFTKALHPIYRSWRDHQSGLRSGVIEWMLPANARILVIGDWGTGQNDARDVLLAARALADQDRPIDAIIHLGDVYYSGTLREYQQHYVNLLRRKDTFLDTPVFSLAGNHEYYCGGEGFYNIGLKINDHLPSSRRQDASYFCLRSECGTWQFLAMDTGYNDHVASLWQQGWNLLHHVEVQPALRPEELRWLWDKLENSSFKGSTVLLSHHQLMSANAPWKRWPKDNLRNGVNWNLFTAFSDRFAPMSGSDKERRVVAWFWGHEHNLLFFKPQVWPVGGSSSPPQMGPRHARCIGHGSIPVWKHDNPYDQANSNIDYVDDWPQYELGTTSCAYGLFRRKGDLYNKGFALLDLQGRDKAMRARYFQVPRVGPSSAAPVAGLVHQEAIQTA